MSNIIRPMEFSANEEWIVMSNQGTDCFLDLLICAADALEQTENQNKLISFLKECKEINTVSPGTAGFDLTEMPWVEDTIYEDAHFLVSVIKQAQEDDTIEKLPYEVNKDIVLPWLKQLEVMVDDFPALMAYFPF